MMHNRKSNLRYAFVTFAMGAALLLAGPVGAVADDSDDNSKQSHLKSWSNIIPNAKKRFVVLADFNNEAVLDRETGLVWELGPITPKFRWDVSLLQCISKSVGGRKGWRLPFIPELTSLIDPSVNLLGGPGPALPLGHPFLNVPTSEGAQTFWSANSIPWDTIRPTIQFSWSVDFRDGGISAGSTIGSASLDRVWCVRSSMNAVQY